MNTSMTGSRGVALAISATLFLCAGACERADQDEQSHTHAAHSHATPQPLDGAPPRHWMTDSITRAMPAEPVARPPRVLTPAVDWPGLAVGDLAPRLTLPRADGAGEVDLGGMYDAGPTIVLWVQGSWRPSDVAFLNAMLEAMPQIRAFDGQVVAITREPREAAAALGASLGLPFPILLDADGQASKAFHVAGALTDETRPRLSLPEVPVEQLIEGDASTVNASGLVAVNDRGVVVWSWLSFRPNDRPTLPDSIEALRIRIDA